MSEAFWTHTFEILAMLLVAFLLGLLLGYILWYKWRRMYIDLQSEHERLVALHRDLEKDHASLRYKAEQSDKENAELRRKNMSLEGDVSIWKSKLAKCEEERDAGAGGTKTASATAMGAVAGAVATVGAPPAVPDDLKKIEGIGPKIEKLCNGIGIYTWRQLANTSVETLQKMLDDAGPNYKIAEPSTWPEQAKMAADGKWEELKKYQDFLIGGRDPK